MIDQAVKLSGETGYKNSYQLLGGSELNDTHALDFTENKKLVLQYTAKSRLICNYALAKEIATVVPSSVTSSGASTCSLPSVVASVSCAIISPND